LIVVTVLEKSAAATRRRLAGLGAGAGMVELRLDHIADEPWEELVSLPTLPVMVTCRSEKDGGGFSGSESDRCELLRRALRAGAAMVDIEVGTLAEDLLVDEPARQLVLSLHEWHPGQAGVVSAFERLLATPAPVTLKLAFSAARASEALLARGLLARAREEGRQAVVLPMGESAAAGRIMAPAWGACWTYAAADGAAPAAAGQLPLRLMADLYDVDSIRADEPLTGLLGCPIAASLSPWMHNRALRQSGLGGRYLPFAEDDAADFILNAGAWGLRGLSVTHPHKRAVLPWVHELSEAARGCGAVNTLTFAGERIHGENTDAGAALQALHDALPEAWSWAGRQVAVAGAGGAARAVAWALVRRQASVTLYCRDLQRGGETAQAVGAGVLPLSRLPGADVDVLVQATPVGSWPDVEGCLLPEAGTRAALVFDMISNPEETLLLRRSQESGTATQSGLAMLIRQGEEQFRLWHQQDPPPGSFEAAAREGLRLWGAA
jgi:shikimate dehydrogenase/3-dehydroquinate dehydratase type I